MFEKLKNSRGAGLSKLTEKLEAMNKGGGQKDDRIYKPAFNKKTESGYAIVRLLPAKSGDNLVKVAKYGFKGTNGWYNETSLFTVKEDDPVAISNRLYRKKAEVEGNDTFKAIADKRKMKTNYYVNVFVVKDTEAPENDGKVMIYEFGQQIIKLIESAAAPTKVEIENEGKVAIDPFDMWTGANLIINIAGNKMPDSNTGQMIVVPNYEKSKFAGQTELFPGDDAKKEEIFNLTYDLSEFTKVKTFDELAERFKKVTGEVHNALEGGDPTDSAIDTLIKQNELQTNQVAAQQPASSGVVEDDAPFDTEGSESDDVLELFRKMAQ